MMMMTKNNGERQIILKNGEAKGGGSGPVLFIVIPLSSFLPAAFPCLWMMLRGDFIRNERAEFHSSYC
jgi:hypothetical protein